MMTEEMMKQMPHMMSTAGHMISKPMATGAMMAGAGFAATVHGEPGRGYQAMKDVEKCVNNALRKMNDERYAGEDLRSIVFPMMGTGAGGGPVEEIAPRLLDAAISYLSRNRASHIETVYFSAWNHRDLDACSTTLKNLDDVEPEIL